MSGSVVQRDRVGQTELPSCYICPCSQCCLPTHVPCVPQPLQEGPTNPGDLLEGVSWVPYLGAEKCFVEQEVKENWEDVRGSMGMWLGLGKWMLGLISQEVEKFSLDKDDKHLYTSIILSNLYFNFFFFFPSFKIFLLTLIPKVFLLSRDPFLLLNWIQILASIPFLLVLPFPLPSRLYFSLLQHQATCVPVLMMCCMPVTEPVSWCTSNPKHTGVEVSPPDHVIWFRNKSVKRKMSLMSLCFTSVDGICFSSSS